MGIISKELNNSGDRYFSGQFRKKLILYLFASIGSLLALIFGIDAIYRQEYTFASVLLFICAGLAIILTFLWKVKDLTLISLIGALFMLLANIFLITFVARTDDTAPLWHFIAPPIFLFATNRRTGSLLIIILFLVTIGSFELIPELKEHYNWFFKARFYSSFLTVSILSYITEFVRERTYKAFQNADRDKGLYVDQVLQQNEEIQSQRDQLEKTNAVISKTNCLLTDSISYARYIQEAILPDISHLRATLPQGFIFFRPRDIVSGDFYWFSKHQDSFFIAAVDCTGHGVPGAFMSMIGNTLLNEIVNEKKITSPAAILNELDNGIERILQQHHRDEKSRDDGMDISLCRIDVNQKKLTYALAGHFSYIRTPEGIQRLTGNVQSIGHKGHSKNFTSFSENTLDISDSMQLYLFTDGYLDQFGGPANTKFMVTRFESLLEQCKEISMSEQEYVFKNAFNEWKNFRPQTTRQIDDVLVMGFDLSNILW